MFNNFNLSDEEIVKIISDYKNLIYRNSIINGQADEDLTQEIQLRIFEILSRNRKNNKI
ncbi:MAG: hypothetical protein HFJ49_05090, partial [Clostridia bacterium]|nr:hypothetical protein [Clostridia bacterium]